MVIMKYWEYMYFYQPVSDNDEQILPIDLHWACSIIKKYMLIPVKPLSFSVVCYGLKVRMG